MDIILLYDGYNPALCVAHHSIKLSPSPLSGSTPAGLCGHLWSHQWGRMSHAINTYCDCSWYFTHGHGLLYMVWTIPCINEISISECKDFLHILCIHFFYQIKQKCMHIVNTLRLSDALWVSNLTIISTDNSLSPGQCQAIIWTNAGILLIGPLITNFSEISIEILTFSFKKMHLKVLSVKSRPFCLNVLAE